MVVSCDYCICIVPVVPQIAQIYLLYNHRRIQSTRYDVMTYDCHCRQGKTLGSGYALAQANAQIYVQVQICSYNTTCI